MRYSILLNVEGGSQVEIICKNKKDFDKKVKICKKMVPDAGWKQKRI